MDRRVGGKRAGELRTLTLEALALDRRDDVPFEHSVALIAEFYHQDPRTVSAEWSDLDIALWGGQMSAILQIRNKDNESGSSGGHDANAAEDDDD